VIVPAHNEEGSLTRILTVLKAQLVPGDRLLVVADCCTDSTASVATAMDAEVLVRPVAEGRGKGFALAAALDFLAGDPPEVVAVFDADTVLEAGVLDRAARLVRQTGRPVQAVTRPWLPGLSAPVACAAGFAFAFRNVVRQRGLFMLGLPAHLNGTAMFIPWYAARAVKWGHGRLAEDMELGWDLVKAGHPPLLDFLSSVSTPIGAGSSLTLRQRRRWIHGHLNLLRKKSWSLLTRALSRRDVRGVFFALDAASPPLSLTLALLISVVVFGAIAVRAGTPAGPVWLAGGILVLAMACLSIAWWRFGREVLPPRRLHGVPWLLILQVPTFLRYLVVRERFWTDRPEHRTAEARRD
jgi:cellulose synthase/poly-beta-1,6-N-acetylglucosamine synthase-like glycosyltransferase